MCVCLCVCLCVSICTWRPKSCDSLYHMHIPDWSYSLDYSPTYLSSLVYMYVYLWCVWMTCLCALALGVEVKDNSQSFWRRGLFLLAAALAYCRLTGPPASGDSPFLPPTVGALGLLVQAFYVCYQVCIPRPFSHRASSLVLWVTLKLKASDI